mgnify:CR=1 FL=1
MDVIDGNWIRSRLSGKRGEQAQLAQAMGLNSDKISKTLAGKRKVKAHEIPALLAFFGEASTHVDLELAELWSQLTAQERLFLLNSARAQISFRDPPPEKSDGD